ncbi:hypothetical protein EJ05DRAFT_519967 [Pseudovirgaria hyperparasitica]|uniref:C3H1-type domain-containing protein n=1 Tax=Pseudovirgaria hyperparasitica TaxID=470096 RepID=A0A6A6VZU7_9PEZI|nr:uncharacterized protein EJ05DRAFT_519967 [Pseudovirgaria hyperparasitica]KAF2755264.1 hypothetical protein EJ05DRAFT_519967 [Pseudovirgaria hyperparasitica]
MDQLKRQFEEFEAQDAARSNCLHDLMKMCLEVMGELSDATRDPGSSSIDTRELNHKATEDLEKLQRDVHAGSSILVLIDADADEYIFDSKYLVKGTVGGLEAASALQTHLRHYFEKEHAEIAGLPFVIKLYANLQGLKHTIARVGLTEASANLEDFARGFNQTNALVDFIDVGHGREQVDFRIRGLLDHHMANPTTKHIVFGACHDNGYVRMLNALLHEEGMREKLTLLAGFRIGEKYRMLELPTTEFPSLFWSGHLIPLKPLVLYSSLDKPYKEPNKPLRLFADVKSTPSGRPTASEGETSGTSKSEGAIDRPHEALVDSTESMSGSEAIADQAGILDVFEPGCIVVNGFGQRIDMHLPKACPATYARLERRNSSHHRRRCNDYIFNNGCWKGPNPCEYLHEMPTDTEIIAIRHKIRLRPCRAGLRCRDPACLYGHNCQCDRANCGRFPIRLHQVAKTNMRKIRPNSETDLLLL